MSSDPLSSGTLRITLEWSEDNVILMLCRANGWKSYLIMTFLQMHDMKLTSVCIEVAILAFVLLSHTVITWS